MLVASACGDDDGDGSAAAKAAPVARITFASGVSGLESFMTELVSAVRAGDQDRAQTLAASLELPDPTAWFEQHFPPEVATRLVAEYEPLRGRVAEVTARLQDLLAGGSTLLAVERFDDPANADATGYQSLALRAMTHDIALYSVRLRKDGEGEGFHIWSFIHDGESWRWIGKLRAITGQKPADPDPLELRVRSAPR